MTAKHTSGTTKETAAPAQSLTRACSGVMSAPPRMAMIRPEAAILASSCPMPSRAMP